MAVPAKTTESSNLDPLTKAVAKLATAVNQGGFKIAAAPQGIFRQSKRTDYVWLGNATTFAKTCEMLRIQKQNRHGGLGSGLIKSTI